MIIEIVQNFFRLTADQNVSTSILQDNKKFNFSKVDSASGPLRSEGMTFGFVTEGVAKLNHLHGKAEMVMSAGMYFSVDTSWTLKVDGNVLLMTATQYDGLNTFGGPLENYGRLKYIDNCSDSLIVPPTKLGDPCLNLLVFPPDTRQSPHLHPSFRAGMVVSGAGSCVLEGQTVSLNVNDFFIIPANLVHCFHSGNNGLRVIAFHPDSDFGPTDHIHPMINRTILETK